MLSKKQKLLMKVIYSHAIRKEGVCLIRPIDLLKEIPLSSDFRRDELESNLKALVTEDFFEMITTDKKVDQQFANLNDIVISHTETILLLDQIHNKQVGRSALDALKVQIAFVLFL